MKREWLDAIEGSDLAAIRALASELEVLNSLDRYGQTALMRAAKAGQAEVVALLVELGAELNHASKYNLSATMLAVLGNHAEVVRILRDAGADPSLTGSGAAGFYGKTALDLAVAASRDDIAALLREGRQDGDPDWMNRIYFRTR